MQSASSARPVTVIPGAIAIGYAAWINERHRAASAEIKFGDWWRMDQTYWRMAWIEGTQELYAEELGRSDRFILLGELDRAGVQSLLHHWYDGDNLEVFLQRLGAVRASEAGRSK